MDLEEGVRYTCHGKKISNFQQDNWKFQLIKNLMNLKKKKKKKKKKKEKKKKINNGPKITCFLRAAIYINHP
jgi:hypothetical protein